MFWTKWDRPALKMALRRAALPAAFYVVLTLLIIGPWLRPGFVLSLDMVFGPLEPTPNDEFYGFDAPVLGAKQIPEALVSGLGALIGPDWAQKVILGLIFLIAGVSGHVLPPVRSPYARYAAGALYLLNPFVYARVLAGQWFVLAGYAFIPLALWSADRTAREPSLRRVIITVLLISCTAFNAQMFVLTVVAVALLGLVRFARRPERRLALGYLAGAVLLFILNIYWVIPALTADNTVLQEITERDLVAFAPLSQFVNPSISVFGLYGFWREGYEYPVDEATAVFFLILPLVWLAVYGVFTRSASPLVRTVTILGFIGFVLGTGIAGPFDWLFRFLAENVPLFDGFRDSQKFVALLVLAYAMLGAVGLDALFDRARPHRRWRNAFELPAVALVLVLIGAYTFTAFWGFGGRLKAVNYPDDWAAALQVLDSEAGNAGVLVLPWDTYAEYPWSPNQDKSVRTLAKAYFDQHLIYPKQVIKRAGIYSQSSSPEQVYIRSLFDDAALRTDFGARIAPLNARYVLVAKAGDWDLYRYLDVQEDLELLFDGPNIRIYRSTVASARAETSPGGSPVQVERVSPARYRLQGGAGAGLIRFVAPNGDIAGWELDGAPPADATEGFAGLFETAGDGFFQYHPALTARRWIWVSSLAAVVTAVLLAGRPARAVEQVFRDLSAVAGRKEPV